MCPTCSYYLREMKLLIKYELLQSWWHGLLFCNIFFILIMIIYNRKTYFINYNLQTNKQTNKETNKQAKKTFYQPLYPSLWLLETNFIWLLPLLLLSKFEMNVTS